MELCGYKQATSQAHAQPLCVIEPRTHQKLGTFKKFFVATTFEFISWRMVVPSNNRGSSCTMFPSTSYRTSHSIVDRTPYRTIHSTSGVILWRYRLPSAFSLGAPSPAESGSTFVAPVLPSVCVISTPSIPQRGLTWLPRGHCPPHSPRQELSLAPLVQCWNKDLKM